MQINEHACGRRETRYFMTIQLDDPATKRVKMRHGEKFCLVCAKKKVRKVASIVTPQRGIPLCVEHKLEYWKSMDEDRILGGQVKFRATPKIRVAPSPHKTVYGVHNRITANKDIIGKQSLRIYEFVRDFKETTGRGPAYVEAARGIFDDRRQAGKVHTLTGRMIDHGFIVAMEGKIVATEKFAPAARPPQKLADEVLKRSLIRADCRPEHTMNQEFSNLRAALLRLSTKPIGECVLATVPKRMLKLAFSRAHQGSQRYQMKISAKKVDAETLRITRLTHPRSTDSDRLLDRLGYHIPQVTTSSIPAYAGV